jgi:hypothetical protein
MPQLCAEWDSRIQALLAWRSPAFVGPELPALLAGPDPDGRDRRFMNMMWRFVFRPDFRQEPQ